ncbi:hypothetical protein F2P56_007511 [Juglans regia]|uniref:Protein SIEVE ELEMENT OCCLUSION B-like n=2 Tax=Juglans regia TaxID=51240 RepID=A0A2I4FP22_JUGRE|nr:protein SIEVE ELEMENT OCCLUSION B-like [Juglans regia]KAF5475735.1 hypothetical protein F2P56_007511 [Juglans regia]
MSSNIEILDRDQQPCSNGELQSLIKSMSDGQLLNQIYETHLPPIQIFDPTSLFSHIKEVLYLATHIVDNALQGTQDLENLEVQESWNMAGMYNHLSCTLEQISSELAVKAPDGASELRETSMSILKNVSSYSWAAKAVLTLAAFALDYGDFWNLSRLQYSLDQLAKAVGIEKVLVQDPPLKRPDLPKWEKEIGEVSNLIKETLEVIEFIVELERLSNLADIHGNILALTTAKDCIRLHAYWAIITVVACTTQMFYLSSDNNDKEVLELSPLTQKMDLTLNLLKKNIKDCHQQIEEVKKYQQEEEEVPEIPKKILEGFKAMIFAEENLQPVLTDGSTNKMLSLDVLKGKNILLFISDIDISVEEISILKPIYDGTRTDDQYKIVWIPMVEQWTDDTQTKFEILQSNIPWYIIQHFSKVIDIGHDSFSTQGWNLKNEPIVVNINPQGEVEHPNAVRMIRLWRMNSFPFTITAEKALIPPVPRKPRFRQLTVNIRQTGPWSVNLDEEEYRFFYGFTNIRWKQQFIRHMTIIFHDSTIKDSETRIKWYWIGECTKKEDVQKLVSGKHDPKKILLPFKSDSGWVELRKGPDTIILGDKGTTILKVLEKFKDWKGFLNEFGLDHCFRDCHIKLQKALPPN